MWAPKFSVVVCMSADAVAKSGCGPIVFLAQVDEQIDELGAAQLTGITLVDVFRIVSGVGIVPSLS